MRGFSLIEMMIGIVLLGALLAMGIPAFNTYGQNAKVLSAAQAFQAMVLQARAEAVRLNTDVELVLTDDTDPVAAIASLTGANIMLRSRLGTPNYSLIETKSGKEGSASATGSSTMVTGTLAIIVFKPLGNTSLAALAAFKFTSAANSPACVKDGGTIRCLNVEVTPGGQSRLCDPNVVAADATDSRACST